MAGQVQTPKGHHSAMCFCKCTTSKPAGPDTSSVSHRLITIHPPQVIDTLRCRYLTKDKILGLWAPYLIKEQALDKLLPVLLAYLTRERGLCTMSETDKTWGLHKIEEQGLHKTGRKRFSLLCCVRKETVGAPRPQYWGHKALQTTRTRAA